MVEEATVDAYDPYEQACGWQCALEEHLSFPFAAKLLGEPITIEGVDINNDIVVAVCRRNNHQVRISLKELHFDQKTTSGMEWIKAYLRWEKGG